MQEPTVLLLVKALCNTNFITISTTALHWFLSVARLIYHVPFYLRPIISTNLSVPARGPKRCRGSSGTLLLLIVLQRQLRLLIRAVNKPHQVFSSCAKFYGVLCRAILIAQPTSICHLHFQHLNTASKPLNQTPF